MNLNLQNNFLQNKKIIIDSEKNNLSLALKIQQQKIEKQRLEQQAIFQQQIIIKEREKQSRLQQQIILKEISRLQDKSRQNNSLSKINDPKVYFRNLCSHYINYIRQLEIPDIELNKINECVYIEYREFPHMEFLLRNSIIKLGPDWSYSVVCGIENYDYIKKMCALIHKNIRVIKTEYSQLNQSTYSIFLASVEFWNMFSGEKILLCQEDSCIFNKNIDDFLEYDYIGAPWPFGQNDNAYGVGNGGFSLRTKQIMIDVINKVSILNTEFNSSTLEYIKNSNMTVGPEDVYFSLNMIRYKIGKVAPRNLASEFSTESILNLNSFGGHNFWINDKYWPHRIFKSIVKTFSPKYDLINLEHRGGWKYILEDGLIKNNFYEKQSNVDFYDVIDLKMNDIIESSKIGRKWCGIFHFTPFTPSHLNMCDINLFFDNSEFLKALEKCIFVIALSQDLTNFLKLKFKKLNIEIDVYFIKHPVVMDVPLFELKEYISNNNKNIIQIGRQLRKITSIYLLENIEKHNKLWLTGTKNIKRCIEDIDLEKKYLKMPDKTLDLNSVKMFYTRTFEEYDELLKKNIVFLDLWDSSVNNAILECICRNTPVIVNKLPAVVEYLGENYPLYFENLSDIQNLMQIDNITNAHNYLKNINKQDLTLSHFTSKLYEIVSRYNY
jgi:hypothetical protein